MKNKVSEGKETYDCLYCGSPVRMASFNLLYEIPKIMHREHLCYRCASWERRMENPDPNRIIIDSNLYVAYPFDKTPNHFKAQKGRIYFIIFWDGRTLKTNNMQIIDTVPEPLRPAFPDTAVFAGYHKYRKVRAMYGYHCHRKGCWDRYNCLWYDLAKEKKPWNKIPKDWVPGGEYCPNYIQKIK